MFPFNLPETVVADDGSTYYHLLPLLPLERLLVALRTEPLRFCWTCWGIMAVLTASAATDLTSLTDSHKSPFYVIASIISSWKKVPHYGRKLPLLLGWGSNPKKTTGGNLLLCHML